MLTYSIGELVDKLCVVHLKLWHIEERIEQIKLKEPESLTVVEPLLNQVVSLNELRVKIVNSINEFFENQSHENN